MFTFKNMDYLTDGEIDLIIQKKICLNYKIGCIPTYKYKITMHGSNTKIGNIDIRIYDNENVCYFGNIGYKIYENFRGNNYAAKSCKIIKKVALAHGMHTLIITCNSNNIPSRKTCEKIGAKLIKIITFPPNNKILKDGERQRYVYEWVLS